MKKHHTKQMAFVAVLLATLTLIGGCGNQEPSDTATESAPDTEVTTTGAASAAETPVVLTETQKIEKILTDRITEQYTMTQINRITINDDLGTEADGDYIALHRTRLSDLGPKEHRNVTKIFNYFIF